MPTPRRTGLPSARGLFLAVGAGCMYGAWALWANLAHGSSAAWRAAGTQFFISFVVTLTMTTVMEHMHTRGASRLGRVGGALVVAVGVTIIFTLGLHIATGTPELLGTVAPVVMLGALYCVAYVANLERELRKRLAAEGT